MKFTTLGLDEQLIEAIGYMGFENATPIQAQSIPEILKGKDIIGCAQTGTGKTAAFVLPILHKIAQKPTDKINTLIIVPTRELAVQIEQQIQGLSYFISVSSKAIYGGGDGKDWSEQKEALVTGTNVIVATPGKLLSHLKMGYTDFSSLEHLILDEADRMLDMGFVDDLKMIFKNLPSKRQNLMFSATMAKEIRNFARTLLKDPVEINLALSKPAEGVKQSVYLCFDEQKNALIKSMLAERQDYKRIIIFSSTKEKVGTIVKYLKQNNFKASGISSNLEQDEREEVLRGFKSGRISLLVATDVMSRGIDIKEINMVINYDVPRDAEDYVHRVGRTARANTKGEAVSLINPKDMPKLSKIQDLIGSEIPVSKLPEALGEGPEWREKPKSKPKKKYKKKWNNKKSKSGGPKKGGDPKKGKGPKPKSSGDKKTPNKPNNNSQTK
ncbi:DEAD/DEAH box helicase [Brumimicrobium aurantiacum]|uniref:DEAD/DEAH box helicase n=1 Tax=Brumimicrobium aurantiacum TaxID=1737063 RepID=A0A3E1EX45_9FLAO|nr:DEAD/DEAH box helicase [Brumimicrobium aurantiacum]RFC54126.1 DEAD/DEAH box helicase [Brumimicrobium aurantiacum]